jgi:nicotinamidase-related amidase
LKTPNTADGALLLCLDMQPVFLRAVADGGKVLRRCQFAVASARALGVRVAFTEQVPQKLGATDPALLGLAEAPEVHPKNTFSALATGSQIAAGGVKHLLLCGVETPICVYQTAVDALRAGLEVTVLQDCVGARREADAGTCLEALARAGAYVLPSETVFYSILGAATHPSFRAYTELVKEYA